MNEAADGSTHRELLLLKDELEIRNLIARLAHTADDGSLDDYAPLFTEDASWGGAGQPERRGRAEIYEAARLRRQQGLAGPGVASRHVVTTTWIEIDGARAKSRSVFHFYVGVDSQSPSLVSLGVYRDSFEKTAEGWKLSERALEGNAKDLEVSPERVN